MTVDEAEKIFKSWQNYQEIADKLHTVFPLVPESFLPYPVEVLEEALNIIMKLHSGDQQFVHNTKSLMALYLSGYYMSVDSNGKSIVTKTPTKDEEVLKTMKKYLDLIFENPDLLEATLKNLKRSRDSWAEFKN